MSLQASAKQFLSGRFASKLALLAVCLVLIAACGKRPPQVDAPAGAAQAGFPHTYPNPAKDPAP